MKVHLDGCVGSEVRRVRPAPVFFYLVLFFTMASVAAASSPAADNACAVPPYDGGGSLSGLNGGYGFGPWIVVPEGSGPVAGSFIGDSNLNGGGGGPGINCSSGAAWGLYANSGAEVLALRLFDGSLIVGQQLTIAMDNGWIDGPSEANNVVELQLLNADGAKRFGFHFRGGESEYQIYDGSSESFERGTGIPFTDGGLRLRFTLLTVHTYSVEIVRLANASTTTLVGALGGPAGTAIDRILLVHRNAGADTRFDSFFNDLAITCNGQPPAPAASSDSPRCTGQDLHLFAQSAAGATYEWTGPNGFTSLLQNPVVYGATTADAGTYRVRATLNGCTSAESSTTAVVTPTPAQPAPYSDSPVCEGSPLQLFANVEADHYTWTGPDGFTSSERNPVIAQATAAAAGTYNLVVEIAGCVSPMGSTPVDILAWSMQAPPDLSIECGAPYGPEATGYPLFSGGCGAQPQAAYEDTILPGPCPTVGNITRRWTAVTAAGTVLAADQRITVTHSTGPILDGVPADATVECGNIPPPPRVTAADACSLIQRIPTNGLVLYYSFDHNDPEATDESGSGNHGVISNAVFVPNGFLGGARYFDGNGDFIRVPNNAQLGAANFTVTAWAWLFSASDVRGLFGKHQATYDEGSFWMFADPTGFHSQMNGYAHIVTPVAPVLAGWTMATLTYDGSIMSLYLNDTLVDQRYAPGYIGNSLDLLIGAGEYCFSYTYGEGLPGIWWHGFIDEVRVYNRALSDYEVEQLHIGQSSGGVEFSEEVSGDCPRIITRTWTAEDSCGNVSAASQVLTVVDTQPPSLQNVPPNVVVACGRDVPPVPLVTAVDNCAGDVPVQIVESEEHLEKGEVLIRTWSTADSCGNATSAVQRITVLDNTLPVLSGVPEDVTVEAGEVPPPATVTGSDDCGMSEDPPPSGGLVLLFEFDTDAGAQALDSSGHGQVGQVQGATFVEDGHIGGAYYFDGSDDYIRVPMNACLRATQFTASVWAWTLDEHTTAPARGLLGKHQAGENANSCWVYQDATGLNAQLWTMGPDSRINTSPAPLYNRWALVTMTYDGRFHRLYIDGQLAGENEIFGYIGNDLDLLIGAGEYSYWGHAPSWPWNGYIDDVRVYDRALSPEEVADLHEDTEERDTSVPVVFSETTNATRPVVILRTWTATDGSGNSVTATQRITIVDRSSPVLSGQGPDMTIECPAEPSFTAPTAYAPCSPEAVEIRFSDSYNTNFTCPVLYAVTRTWIAVDACGNTSAPVSQTISVADTTGPVLACPGNLVVAPAGCSSGTVSYAATALDGCGGEVPVTFVPPSGSVLGPGTHTVTASAADACGNVSTCAFTVTVLPRIQVVFAGGPLQDDNADDNIETDQDIMNLFKSGSRVPHKVRLIDCAGLDVTTSLASQVTVRLNVTQRQYVNATTSQFVNDLPESYSGAGSAGGVMVLTDSQFHYNLNTTGYPAGSSGGPSFFRSHVTVEYLTAPGVIAGEEDVWLESR